VATITYNDYYPTTSTFYAASAFCSNTSCHQAPWTLLSKRWLQRPPEREWKKSVKRRRTWELSRLSRLAAPAHSTDAADLGWRAYPTAGRCFEGYAETLG